MKEGPRDFALGLVQGTRSLWSNTVYGTFNAASKISGSMGKGIATLSFDEKFQRERIRGHGMQPRLRKKEVLDQ